MAPSRRPAGPPEAPETLGDGGVRGHRAVCRRSLIHAPSSREPGAAPGTVRSAASGLVTDGGAAALSCPGPEGRERPEPDPSRPRSCPIVEEYHALTRYPTSPRSSLRSAAAIARVALRCRTDGRRRRTPQNGFKTDAAGDARARAPARRSARRSSRSSPSATRSATTASRPSPTGSRTARAARTRRTVFVNHETSTVPFPYNVGADHRELLQRLRQLPGEQARHPEGRRQSVGARRSSRARRTTSASARTSSRRRRRLREPADPLHQRGGHRLGPCESGTAWTRPPEGAAGARQIGAVVAYDVNAGPRTRRSGAWAGSTTRTTSRSPATASRSCSPATTRSSSNPAQSQVYAYIADDADAVWNDAGELWAFVPDDALPRSTTTTTSRDAARR